MSGEKRAARKAGVNGLALGKTKNAWSKNKVLRFFDVLAATCDVTAAAAAAGIDRSAAYQKRKNDDAFRALWEAALAEAVERTEMLVIEQALKTAAEEPDGAGSKSGAALERAARTMAARDARLKRDGRGQVACMPIDELERLLTRRLAAIERRLSRGRSGQAAGGVQVAEDGDRGPGLPPSREHGGGGRERGEAEGTG